MGGGELGAQWLTGCRGSEEEVLGERNEWWGWCLGIWILAFVTWGKSLSLSDHCLAPR